jgi:hypothetical protein
MARFASDFKGELEMLKELIDTPSKLVSTSVLVLGLCLISCGELLASNWSAPERIDERDAWISTTNDLQGVGAELGYYCETDCIAVIGIPLGCTEGGSIPILVSLEYPDSSQNGTTFGSMNCIVPRSGTSEDVSIMTLIIYQDGEDKAEEILALASKIGIAVSLTRNLEFQAYRFSLDGSMKALAGLFERLGSSRQKPVRNNSF